MTDSVIPPETPAEPAKVAVRRASDWRVGYLSPDEAKKQIEAGAALPVSQEKAREKALDRKYGGIGGTLAAGGEGLARGATMGLSDPAAIEAARAFGSDETAEKVRRHLAEEKEAHPGIALGSELVGTAAPLFLSGGAAAAEEGGALATAIRGAGSLTRATAGVGDAGGNLARALVGEGGYFGTAVSHGVQGAIEGGAYGVGNELSEQSLNGGDHELTAEQLLAAAGHGALAGGVLGAGFGTLGRAAEERVEPLVGKARGFLSDLADKRAAAAAGADGLEGAGDFVLNDIPKAAGKPLEAMTLDEMQGAASKIKAEALGELDAHTGKMDALGHELPSVQASSKMREVTDELRGDAAKSDLVKSLDAIQDDFEKSAGMQRLQNAPIEAGMPPEIHAQVKANLAAKEARINAGARTNYGQLRDLTAQLDALPPSPEVAKMKMAVESVMLDSLKDHGAAELGDSFVAARNRAEKARLIEDATAKKLAEVAQDPAVGLTKAIGGTGAVVALASGHPLGALALLAKRQASQVVAERGQQIVAGMADRLAHLSVAAHVVKRVTQTIRGTMQAFLARSPEVLDGKSASIKLARGGQGRPASLKGGYEREVESVRAAQKDPEAAAQRIGVNLGGLGQHAPGVSTAIASKMTQVNDFLASKIPPPVPGPSLMQPQLKGPAPSEMEMSSFLRVAAVVKNPLSILGELKSGHISFDQVDAVRTLYPKLYAQMQSSAAEAMAKRPTVPPWEKQKRLSTLLNIPLAPTLEGEFVQRVQATYGGPSANAVAQGGPTERPNRGRDNQKARKANLGATFSANTPTQFEAAAQTRA